MAPHRLYVCIEGSLGLRNHLAVRDRLRKHPLSAARYGGLKAGLTARGFSDAAQYGRAKAPFILELLRVAGFFDNEPASIAAMNSGGAGSLRIYGGWRALRSKAASARWAGW
jgi:hypothetical protein